MQKYVIALYIRLSIEDYKYDSLSIENQSLVLHEYAASMPEALNAEIMEFIDNGYSGTNFERPQVSAPFTTNNTVTNRGKLPESGTVIKKLSSTLHRSFLCLLRRNFCAAGDVLLWLQRCDF